MLDLFTVLTSGGIVLFQRMPSATSATLSAPTYLIDKLISDVFMQERSSEKEYGRDGYRVKWAFANDVGLIFVAVYQRILELNWIDELLQAAKRMFTKMYADMLRRGDTTAVIDHLAGVECRFGQWFDGKVKSYEGAKGNENSISVKELAAPLLAIQSNADQPATSDDSTARTPLNSPLLAPAIPTRLQKKKAKKGKNSPYQSSGDETREAKAKGKRGRKWGEAGAYEADGADEILDFSSAPESTYAPANIDALVSSNGNNFDLESDGEEEKTPANRGWSIFSNFVGGKVLTKEDLKDPLEQMHQFLLAKNVANEVSLHICESVEKSLIGQKTGNFESTKNSVRKAINDSLTRILTPTKPTDLLHEIAQVTKTHKRPYTISFVGVNGVGKSTNLSKIAFKLLNNGNSVLIAACDTFRSGAVEQLRKHVVNLRQWVERQEKNGVKIELFERGYGKDAADVAANAVKFALAEGFDVVLIDTAGRRHNDQALMGSLTKFAKQAKPDKILMVAEALVGTDSVSQARSFTNALTSANKGLDGFIISKMDTVEDLVGTVVSMVYSTGVPIWYLGVGQMYGDLRDFKVDWVVSKLMKA